MNKIVKVPISIGELIDKLSILLVKKNNITDENKLKFIEKEFDLLFDLSAKYLNMPDVKKCYDNLIIINSKLWSVEDEIRELEKTKKFDENFIDLARKVYKTNDERFFEKNKINEITNSTLKEIKNYKEYN